VMARHIRQAWWKRRRPRAGYRHGTDTRSAETLCPAERDRRRNRRPNRRPRGGWGGRRLGQAPAKGGWYSSRKHCAADAFNPPKVAQTTTRTVQGECTARGTARLGSSLGVSCVMARSGQEILGKLFFSCKYKSVSYGTREVFHDLYKKGVSVFFSGGAGNQGGQKGAPSGRAGAPQGRAGNLAEQKKKKKKTDISYLIASGYQGISLGGGQA